GDLEGTGEAPQCGQRTVCQDASLFRCAELVQQVPYLGNQQRRETALLRCLDQGREISLPLGDLADLHQEDRLPYAPEAQEHHALGVSARMDPPGGHARRGDDLVAPGQSRRTRACPWSKGVGYGIHGQVMESY